MNNNQESVTQTETKIEGTVTEPVAKTEPEGGKTFTQEEVNAMVAKATAKVTKGMPSKEDLKAFNDWRESQKTESEKQAETLKELESLKRENNLLKNQTVVANAGVDSKFQKFVLSEVSSMEGTFEDNLKSYLKENSQFISSKNEEPKTTGFSQNNSNKPVSDEKAYLDKKYANNPYYKK